MRHLLVFGILMGFLPMAAAEDSSTDKLYFLETPDHKCSSSKEFVTTLEYLREQKEFALSEKRMKDLSYAVAQGCSGAAKRFILVTDLLVRAQIGGGDAVKTALKFVQKSDSYVKTFSTIFRSAYLREGLDLDLESSVSMASDLALEYKGDIQVAEQDFFKIVEFCTSTENLDLAKPVCGEMAARLVKHGDGTRKGVYESYKEAFEFLRSEEGPGMVTHEALKLAEHIVAQGPEAVNNFIYGYRYGLSEEGLKLPRKDAVQFASRLTKLSRSPASLKKSE